VRLEFAHRDFRQAAQALTCHEPNGSTVSRFVGQALLDRPSARDVARGCRIRVRADSIRICRRGGFTPMRERHTLGSREAGR